MKIKVILIGLIIFLLIEAILYIIRIVSVQSPTEIEKLDIWIKISRTWILSTTSIISLIIFIYMTGKIFEKNPGRYYKLYWNTISHTMSKGFDFSLIINFLKYTVYIFSISFAFLNIIIFLELNIWAYDINIVMSALGFNMIILFIRAIEEIYLYILNESEKK